MFYYNSRKTIELNVNQDVNVLYDVILFDVQTSDSLHISLESLNIPELFTYSKIKVLLKKKSAIPSNIVIFKFVKGLKSRKLFTLVSKISCKKHLSNDK